MDTVLELCESDNSIYPKHFEEFLNNCVDKLKDNFLANDYLFAAVYFLVVETGFTPVGHDGIACHDSENFDIRKLRSIKSYPNNQIEKMKKCKPPKTYVYDIEFSLGNSQCRCQLQGVPSSEIDTHLIINFLLPETHVVRAICLNTETYIEKIETSKFHNVRLKNLKELSILVKNEISVYLKNLILMNEGEGCYANLFCLPDNCQRKIIYSLTHDAAGLSNLAATCSYFYNIIINDSELWEILCFKEYTAQKINDTLLKLSDQEYLDEAENINLFRKTFLKLKNEEMKRHFRRGPPVFY